MKKMATGGKRRQPRDFSDGCDYDLHHSINSRIVSTSIHPNLPFFFVRLSQDLLHDAFSPSTTAMSPRRQQQNLRRDTGNST
jgi:hypothetical protein